MVVTGAREECIINICLKFILRIRIEHVRCLICPFPVDTDYFTFVKAGHLFERKVFGFNSRVLDRIVGYLQDRFLSYRIRAF